MQTSSEITQATAIPPQDDTDHTNYPLSTVVDLCLFRVVSDLCGGRVLPFGVRQIIKDYTFEPFDNRTLPMAVNLWCEDRATALQRYGEINDWDVSRVTNMDSLFSGRNTFNDCIDRWDVRNVASMKNMFAFASTFNQPLAAWNVGQVTNMTGMFARASAFNQPLDTWNVSQVTNMTTMFTGASSFNQPLSSWDVSRVTDMSHMFSRASSFNQSLSAWDVSHVKNAPSSSQQQAR